MSPVKRILYPLIYIFYRRPLPDGYTLSTHNAYHHYATERRFACKNQPSQRMPLLSISSHTLWCSKNNLWCIIANRCALFFVLCIFFIKNSTTSLVILYQHIPFMIRLSSISSQERDTYFWEYKKRCTPTFMRHSHGMNSFKEHDSLRAMTPNGCTKSIILIKRLDSHVFLKTKRNCISLCSSFLPHFKDRVMLRPWWHSSIKKQIIKTSTLPFLHSKTIFPPLSFTKAYSTKS